MAFLNHVLKSVHSSTEIDSRGQVELKPYTPVISSEGPASMATVQIGFGGPWPFYAKDGEDLNTHHGPWQAHSKGDLEG